MEVARDRTRHRYYLEFIPVCFRSRCAGRSTYEMAFVTMQLEQSYAGAGQARDPVSCCVYRTVDAEVKLTRIRGV